MSYLTVSDICKTINESYSEFKSIYDNRDKYSYCLFSVMSKWFNRTNNLDEHLLDAMLAILVAKNCGDLEINKDAFISSYNLFVKHLIFSSKASEAGIEIVDCEKDYLGFPIIHIIDKNKFHGFLEVIETPPKKMLPRDNLKKKSDANMIYPKRSK